VSSGPNAIAADQYGRTADVYYARLSPSGTGQWARTTPFPYIAASPRCLTFASDIYCIEAEFVKTGYTNSAEAYYAQLSSNGVGTWVQSAAPASMTAGCSAVGGYAYCFGGAPCGPIGPNGDCYSPSYSTSLSSAGLGTWNPTTSLPTAGYAIYVTAESYIYYLSNPNFIAKASAGGIGAWQTTTGFPDSFSPGACASSGAYIYCVAGSTGGAYFAQVGAPNQSSLMQLNPPPFPRAQYLGPAWSGSGGCSVSVNGTFAGGVCFQRDIGRAAVFDCAASAATPSGCRTTVVSPTKPAYNFNVTIWYPDANVTSPSANCEFLPSLGYNRPSTAWCISISQSSFVIAQPIEMSGRP
jgi:hypothetical protein